MLGHPETIGRYKIIDCVGRGGMGVLYRAHDPLLERDVAIKLMLVDFKLDPAARERFHREARAVARLQHRNVVTIHELGDSDGTPYIVMEFLTGRDLEAMLRSDTPLTLDEKLDIAIQLSVGLSYAHEQGIVHRDIKPGNVRVLDDGTVKILDFGIAKFAMSAVTHSGSIMGTAHYMAPEQIMGQPVDGRADLFSTGVLLYEILTGQKPFNGDTPTTIVYQILHAEPTPIRSIVPDLPEQLADIVGRALKKEADQRYSRANEMAGELQFVRSILAGASPTPVPGATGISGGMGPLRTPSGRLIQSPTPAPSARLRSGPQPAEDAMATGAPLQGLDLKIHTEVAGSGTAAAEAARPRTRSVPLAGIAGAVAFIAVLVVVVMTIRSSGRPESTAAGAGAAGAASAASGAAGAEEPPLPTSFGVVSKPAGARISLDGSDTGKVTPAEVPVAPPFPRQIVLSLDGYEPLTVNVEETDVRTGGREYALEAKPQPIQVLVTGSYPFEVIQGSRVISGSSARHNLSLDPAELTIRLRSRQYFLNRTVEVRARDGERATVQVPALGTLAVFSSIETCVVTIDGQEVGFPPIPKQELSSGSHSVSVKCPDGRAQSQNVTVPAGERTAVTFDPGKS